MRAVLAFVLAWSALAGTLTSAPAAVTLTVSPRVGPSPLNVRATMTFGVEMHDETVCLFVESDGEVIVDSPGRSESSCVPHDTKRQGSQTVMQIRELAPGDYWFQAVIRPEDADRRKQSAAVKVMVR